MEPDTTAGGAEEQHHGNYLPKAAGETEAQQEPAAAEGSEEEEEESEEESDDEEPGFERWKPKPKPKKTCKEVMADLKKYLWNPETREFMGRSGKSWSLIILFYLALYSFLAAMFAACMCGLLWSISPYNPTYSDRVVPPGMMMSPSLNGFDISFNASDRSSWEKYTEALQSYLRPYNDSLQEERNIDCRDKEDYFRQDFQPESAERKACWFKRSWLKECSGVQDPDFGYSQGKPCVVLKMNRILGYLPGEGTAINVTCHAQKGGPENLGDIQFYPDNVFSKKYYPYYGKLRHVNYTSPLVAVQLPSVQLDVPLTVQCKLNGKGIINDSPYDRFLGRITFTLRVGA
ncbi:protein ATP1B4 [Lepisosteus oculatus]|uniref:Sodium/potassium-transporting ATPase subunit beta n=1 Tax=Lepisosteus oculatus TaxID=7918 RepID=W5NDQ6_LEPOC|nr:PREDICTED: protein ATP1B4 [Lepisosteus oculatus]